MATNTTIVIKAKDSTKKAFSSVNKGLGKIRTGLNSTQLKVGLLAGIAGFGAIVRSSKIAADSLAKTADKIGISTEALAGLQNAAEITGVSQEVLNKALVKQQVAISDYSNGIGLAKREFEQLGFAQNELAALSADEQFIRISEALKQVENSTDRVNIAYKIYGGRATDLLNTLDLGEAGLRKFREESELFGTSLSRIDAAKIEQANDSMTRISQISRGFGLQLTTELAPILEGIGNLFIENAKQAGGFGVIVSNVIGNILNSVGFLADAFKLLEIVWQGLKVVFLSVFTGIPQILNELQKSIVSIVNLIPGVDVKPFEALERAALGTAQSLFEAKAELLALTLQGVPSENFKQWSDQIQAEAQKAAEAIAATKAATGGGAGAGDIGVIGAGDTESANDAQRLSQKLARLDASLLSEKERLSLAFEEKEFLIEESFQTGLINDMERKDRLLAIEQDQQDKLTQINNRGLTDRQKFDKKSTGDKVKSQLSLMTQMTQGVASRSKTMFKINKALALANAAVTLPDAVIQTFRNNGGYPWGIAPAALMAATGAAQISAISSSSFGGGGGRGPSVSGGASAPSLAGSGIDAVVGTTSLDDDKKGSVNIYINTSNLVDDTALARIVDEKVVPIIQDGVDNRDVILISANSRNAQELAPA